MQSEIRISFLQLLPLHSLSCLAIRWTCLPLRSQSYVMCGKTSWTKIEIRAVHFPPPRKSSSFQGWLLCHLRSRVCYHDLSRYWPFAEINLWMLLHQAGRALDQSHNGFLLFFNVSPPFYSSLLLLFLAAQGEQLSHLHLHPPLPLRLPPYLNFSSSLRFNCSLVSLDTCSLVHSLCIQTTVTFRFCATKIKPKWDLEVCYQYSISKNIHLLDNFDVMLWQCCAHSLFTLATKKHTGRVGK